MPRYATIITADDGAEIVSAIGAFEGADPPRRTGRVEQVAPGVRIGMVRGGPVDAVAGFGFPRQGLDASVVRAATAKLKAIASPAVDGEAPRRARPRKKPARKPRKARTAKATPSDAQG
ncbi:hypothetical protein EN852_030785 [Mesorhizobium sp. M2E.F.Ca.ET.209.01.1.1]|jgi:hypothetical protein|uniref:hypothetical protein n=1 Tax=Mesorhizobium sp. M2E.F.Ca.ET.209.01.1.1 TaxID=2500526 RepID=UPI000FD8FEFC|nr:hypothetical protein [Mesorhizobium sp. M2E.F.Ca.ET.209.01.1.1]TGS09457.1 hypothetical protein EN852_030785 [Mesorhizobium sp. M2E.F.Ca.ET.209.01.1.1]